MNQNPSKLAHAIPALPERAKDIVGPLPRPFATSMIDYLPGSVTWWNSGWVAATTTWGGKTLAHLVDGAWRPLTEEAHWTRRPMVSPDGLALSAVVQEPDADGGVFSVLSNGQWSPLLPTDDVDDVRDWDGRRGIAKSSGQHDAALDASGRLIHIIDGKLICGSRRDPRWSVSLPSGATATLILPSPNRELVLVVLRSRSKFQSHVFVTRDGRSASAHSLEYVVQPVGAWLDEDRIVIARERWPSIEPVIWSWRVGKVETAWTTAAGPGAVRSLAVSPDGTSVAAVGSPSTASALQPLHEGPALSVRVHTQIVMNGEQPVPCLVHEPEGPPRGTFMMFPGGPHEPVWATYAPIADVLVDAGWRVVRVNTRSSGLREDSYRPRGQVRYGIDDLSDARAVLERLGIGPVITMGMSYGAYLCSLLADSSPRTLGAIVLAGFVSPSDIVESKHTGVQAFSKAAFGEQMYAPPRDLRVPHFFAHGARDERIPISALRRYETPGGQFLDVTTEGHGIHSDDAARIVYPHMFDWIEEISS